MHTCRPALFLFAILFSCSSYIHFAGNWNSNSRMDMIMALVEDRSLRIDPYQANTGDKAFIDGHYYSEKPPALAFLGVVPFLIARRIVGIIPIGSMTLFLDWFTTVFTVGWIFALGGVAMFSTLRHFIAPRTAWIVTLFVFLGTVLFPYATMFFSHAATAGFIAIALWAALHKNTSMWIDIVMGMALGLAVASEFQSFIPATGILVISIERSPKSALRAALAAMPFLLLIAWYNRATSGDPLHFPSASHASFPEMSHGFVAMQWPDLHAALSMILSLYRGLLVWSPIFLLALGGLDRKILTSHILFWTLIAVPPLEILFIASFPFWHGGASLGPRYILSMIPLLAVPTAIGFARHRGMGIFLGIVSFALAWGGMIVFPLPLADDPMPLFTMLDRLPYALMNFRAQIGSFVGLTGIVGLLPLFVWVTLLGAFGYRSIPRTTVTAYARTQRRNL